MRQITVGIGELAVSDSSESSIITYALGPCLGVVAYDLERSVGGLVHCQLPLSLEDPEQALRNPARYVDTGVNLLLQRMQDSGAKLDSLVVCVAGGAQVMGAESIFKIAQRNHAVFRKLMWKNSLLITAEDVGGDRPRTMSIGIGSGSVIVSTDQVRHVLYQPLRSAVHA
jgi:chemotaxis protein CheD